jgi:hypothetical protein
VQQCNITSAAPPTKALAELTRVSSKYVVVRTVFGKRNYLIKEVRDVNDGLPVKEGSVIGSDGEPEYYNYFNMYTEDYFKDILVGIPGVVGHKIVPDDSWVTFDNTKIAGRTATQVLGNHQVSGNLLLDWRFLILTK